MHLKVGFFLYFVLFASFCIGQINMTLQLPPAGIVQKSQLWNLVLVNTGNAPEEIHVVLTLFTVGDNQPVLNAETKVITVNKGAVQLKANDLNPIRYNYISSITNADRNPNGFLPIGNFTACYSIYKHQYESIVQLAEDCVPVEVAPLSPPLLNTPANEVVIETPNPQFTWIPPTPINLFNDIGYDLVLAEVLPGQDPTQAIQQNIPVYNVGNYKSLFNNYPATRKSLDTAKTYAWRIVARNNNQFVAQSEVWTFKISSKINSAVKTDDEVYVKLKRGYESGMAITRGPLKIEYGNEANDRLVYYSITNLSTGESIVRDGSLQLNTGQNLLNIALPKQIKPGADKTFLFKFINSRNEEWSLKFSVINPAISE